ncbi:hypothetical protein CIW49_09905 [Mycolicibacterium sp. P1-18]|uniref:hypothetical protein n=1 Tax=Mycolicibacterium sp. P1-18 TaxID=2024615 RepID=UPI0011F1EE9F|nr:hypothetical protein [Mycolicibacterium sp. P1-18]KAA0099861.1 hypothetical protein CIW49_09905 [Mycolicibacterium sp. P1-18]
MSVVVERGLARCPRCVAVADYTFVESGPNSLRYEVHCGKCGEAYCEVHTPVAPDFTAAVDALVVLPPPAVPSALDVRKRQAMAWLASLRAKTSARVGRGT